VRVDCKRARGGVKGRSTLLVLLLLVGVLAPASRFPSQRYTPSGMPSQRGALLENRAGVNAARVFAAAQV